jgi:hypothetical protein
MAHPAVAGASCLGKEIVHLLKPYSKAKGTNKTWQDQKTLLLSPVPPSIRLAQDLLLTALTETPFSQEPGWQKDA